MKLTVRGIIPPMVTPFTWNEEALDVDAIRAETEYFIQAGVAGLCVGGSTGEGAGFSEDEVHLLCKTVVDQARDRIPVIGGIIADTTAEATRKARAAKDGGVMALQVTPPHYLWAPDAEGLVDYYEAIGNVTHLPIVVYNVIPWVNIDASMMRKVISVKWVAGIKQSGGDMHKVADMMHEFHDRLSVFTAVDDLLYPSFCLGVDGAISCLLAIFPEATMQMWTAVEQQDHETARAIHERLLPIWRAIDAPNMPYLTKTIIEMLGRKVGPARSPIRPPSEARRAELRKLLQASGFSLTEKLK